MSTRSTYLASLATCFLMFACASIVIAQDSEVVESITSAQMKALLESEGFPNVEVDSDDDVIVKMHGYNILIFVRGNDYSRILYKFSLGGTSATMRDVNDWNRTKVYSRAYLDNDGDPVLEMDVDLEGGVTIARIKDSVRTFSTSLAAFLREVAK